ncbi:MAG: DUF1559 domain-containing protein [Phycisphaerae bacterium]|jgi:prepilin-type N-terminal cleavage/methylation domain-containing protein/prepilin-type processing-associated H-X9-DG protein
MPRVTREVRPAFTLIELLVVIAVIALLIAILMPVLRSAREKARQTVCLANMRGISDAMGMYTLSNNNWIPYEKRNWPRSADASPSGFPLSAFYIGGHPGRPRPNGSDISSYTFELSYLRDSFRGRPLNPLLYDGLLDRVEELEEAGTVEFEARRQGFSLFACPSDLGTYMSGDTTTDDALMVPAHYLHGSSYSYNYHFVWLWAAGSALAGNVPKFNRDPESRRKYLERANRFIDRQRNFNVSRFVLIQEDAFDASQLNQSDRIGWHRELNRHNLLFLDGHAAYVYTDVHLGNSGPGWKTASLDWYNNPDDPDYEFRDLP